MSTELKVVSNIDEHSLKQGSSVSESSGKRYLSFSLGTEEYALPLLAVKEVIALPEITQIPFTPPYFLGIMNLRGQVISIIDLRTKLGIKPGSSSETSVIICDIDPLVLGVVVDSIDSVLTPSAADLSEKPSIQSSRNTDYITGVFRRDKKMVLFLDIAKTLSVEDQLAVSKANGTKKAA